MFPIQEEISNLKLLEEVSNASGKDAMPARNAACHFKCNFKVKSKRAACWQDCDRRFPKSEKQTVRRDEQSQRRTARNIKRDSIEECKELYDKGEINKLEESNCIKGARFEKRQTVKEKGGGSPIARFGRALVKVNPITATARGAARTLISVNMSGFATRLAPALIPDTEAREKFTPEAIELAKKGWTRVSKAWKNLGGNPIGLKDAILKGFRKKPEKLPRSARKSSIAGFNPYSDDMYYMEYENHSSVSGIDDAVLAAIIAAGSSVLIALIGMIAKIGVKKDPYKSENINPLFGEGVRTGNVENNFPIDPSEPTLDSRGNWIDPTTGNQVDPRTGQQLIMGMNPYLALGLGLVVLTTAGVVIYKVVKK